MDLDADGSIGIEKPIIEVEVDGMVTGLYRRA
jgi:hypothetical protein